MSKKFALFIFSALIAILAIGSLANLSSVEPAKAAISLPPVPGGLKSTFMLGMGNGPGSIGWMTGSGAKWDARYQYISGGVNTPSNWKTWNSPAGIFAGYYINDSAAAGYLPVFTYYQMLQSSPASGSSEADKDYNNLNNSSTMNAYYADFKLLLDQARAYGKTVIIHVEPDLMGFMQIRSTDPNSIPAAVNSSGYGDVAGYPNTLAGFNQALVGLRNKYAPNVLLGFHVSPWASTSGDLGSSKSASFDTQAAAQQTANFYLRNGANYDLMFYDIADRDAALYQSWGDPNKWWDTNNVSFPNFNRFHQFASSITGLTGKRGMLWQLPIGNTISRSMNNTNHHWQDNKTQYYLNNAGIQHLQDLANSGIIGMLFGSGDGNSTGYSDVAGDGITNPNPINNNNAVASVSDDDGGYLRSQGQAYYARGAMTLPSAGGPVPTATATATAIPTATATPTKVPTSTPSPAPVVPANWLLSSAASGAMTTGSTITITGNFTGPVSANSAYILDVEVYNTVTNTKVQQWFTTQNFTPGQLWTVTNTFNASPGNYQVRLGVFTSNWSFVTWLQNGAVFQVK